MFFIPFLYISALQFGILVAKEWSYKEADNWPEEFPQFCAGSRQSPIDIDLSNRNVILKVRENSTLLVPHGFDNTASKTILSNNGRTLEISLKWEKDSQIPYISGGPLGDDEYIFDNLHYVWGANDDGGSEHLISNSKAPSILEAHVAFSNRKYGSITNARSHSDGVATWSVLFMLKAKNSKNFYQISSFKKILDSIPKVVTPGSSTEIEPMNLKKLGVLKHISPFVSYHGSYTRPPCEESVTWMIPLHTVDVSSDQMKIFRSINLKNGDDHNNRPIQPINGRRLYSYVYQ